MILVAKPSLYVRFETKKPHICYLNILLFTFFSYICKQEDTTI